MAGVGLLNRKMILIDLDGTLVDSVPDLAFSVDEMMMHIGQPRWGDAKVREWVGNGVERLVKRALLGQLEGEPDADLYAKAFPYFMKVYAQNTSLRSALYPGISKGLQALLASGFRLGCVTNKAAAFTEPLLKAMGIYDNFEIVISGDTLAKKKPDPLPLLHAAEFFGVPAEQALMVGDSVSDVKAARAAGFAIVCMSYGYNHGMDIRDANPDAVIDSLTELLPLLSA
ncbi:MAG: phosphoglycolate phosphatase [Gammaproteobacteria bacterium]|nr:phosphoglycolate phosphatase [Gammaproteobacteria bacterium]